MVVDVESSSGFSAGTPRLLFEVQPGWVFQNFGLFYDVAPDDERFVIARDVGAEEGAGPTTILVNNFVEELKARAPE